MKKFFSCFILFVLLCLCACSNTANENDCSNSTKENVTLTFIQHSYLKHDSESNGYYFKNDQIAITQLTYEKGFYLDQSEIDNLYKKVKYDVPELVGDGYWSFTFFTKSFDESTGYSDDFLKTQILDENMTIHFAIYG